MLLLVYGPLVRYWRPQCFILTKTIVVFEFLTLKVSMSVLGRTLDSRRSIYVQHGCAQKLGGREVLTMYYHIGLPRLFSS